jgi:hypothetical protein
MTAEHLAELNIGRLLAPQNDPRVADFVAATAKINALADRMPGFVWRLQGHEGVVDPGNPGAARDLVNMSVWENVESLENFVWNTVHRHFYERRLEWFEILGKMHLVMWRVPQGYRPSLDEALERLAHLEVAGESDHAFGWSHVKEARLWRMRQCNRTAAE